MNKLYFIRRGHYFQLFLTVICVVWCVAGCGQSEPVWPESNPEAKPWTRWWWPGNAVDKENIRRELQELASAGIGGVEITSIYGVKGEEQRDIEYLSPRYSEMLMFTIEEAARHGLGVDIPPGSGWRCGGPFVPEEKGLWSLQMKSSRLNAGEVYTPSVGANEEAFSFVGDKGMVTVLHAGEHFTAPFAGTVYVAARVKNGDKVKRASDGGKGWAIDTFDEEITEWYFREFWDRLKLDEGSVRCFFHDSFEYTGDFTPRFSEEFRKRRGYELGEVLHLLAGDNHGNTALSERVRMDYRETLSDLVLESFIRPMTDWANSHGSRNRNQAHGSPGNVLDLYAACDIPETEIFGRVEPGSVDINTNKFASSAANVTGQKLVSSESFTWLNEHWTVTPADMIRSANRLFLSGVNHMFLHGTCYSPDDATWPGWLFYASAQVNSRNPLWGVLPAVFKYIERSQAILQQAQPDHDVLVYWPWHDVAASGDGRMFLNLNIDRGDRAGWFSNYPMAEVSRQLTEEGYAFDYISDRQLLNCRAENGGIITGGSTRYHAVVVPMTTYMPLPTLQKLKELAASGVTVCFDKRFPLHVPGLYQLEERESQFQSLKADMDADLLAGDIITLLDQAGVPVNRVLSQKGYHFLKLKKDNESWYMIVNCGLTVLDEWVDLNPDSKSYLFYHPENGKITKAANRNGQIRIQLEPEQAVFVRCAGRNFNVEEFAYREREMEKTDIEGLWKISFVDGGPVFPGDISTRDLVSWTAAGDEHTRRFAGTAKYTVDFDYAGSAGSGILDLGKVSDCAGVKLNGKDYGVLTGPSFIVRVDNLQPGSNNLEVMVTNVAANRVRDLDIWGAEWKKFHDINFVNIDYLPFDASAWEVREAGLSGPVILYSN